MGYFFNYNQCLPTFWLWFDGVKVCLYSNGCRCGNNYIIVVNHCSIGGKNLILIFKHFVNLVVIKWGILFFISLQENYYLMLPYLIVHGIALLSLAPISLIILCVLVPFCKYFSAPSHRRLAIINFNYFIAFSFAILYLVARLFNVPKGPV